MGDEVGVECGNVRLARSGEDVTERLEIWL